MKRTVSLLTITLLLVSMFTAAFSIRAAETGLSQLTVPDEPTTMQETIKLASQEPPPTEWNQTYGGTGDDPAYAMIQTIDGGYALVGMTASFGAGGWDSWLVKTDSAGNEQWNKTYGGTGDDVAGALVQTVDGGYALAGTTYSFGVGDADAWLVKTDAAGNMQWNKTYGGSGFQALVQTGDGGYALAGDTSSFGAGAADFWLVKTDSAGNEQWNKTYGGTGDDWALALVQTGDGGYALAGETDSFGAGNGDFWLVKTDSAGNEQWNKTYGGTDWDYADSVVQTGDGGYALAGLATQSFGAGGWDSWLVKTDALGNEQWNKTYGGTDSDYARALVQTVDGGYALAGVTRSFGAGTSDFWLVKTDALGNEQWNKTIGGTNVDTAWDLAQTVDGGYALAGTTRSFGAGGIDFWLVKVGGTIYIRADGSIDPPTAPISRDGATYTFTDNVSDGAIVVERDNVVVDGAGYTLQGTNASESRGIDLSGRSNVTIKSMTIKAFDYGIWLDFSSGNIISGNNITANNWFGIWLDSSNNNSVSENSITNNEDGIWLLYSSGNSVSGNNITANDWFGIYMVFSSNNGISGNNITNNGAHGAGIWLWSSSNNRFYHNNFIDNTQQVQIYETGYANVWDDGYPSGGNYWSDYTGVDANGDGIGDTPYVLDAQNVDNYPLMQPFTKIQIPGDINHDGVVNIVDIVIVALEFGHPPPPIVDLRADVNKDGLVNIVDIAIVALHFGETG